MATGAYLSSKAERQVHQAEINLERNSIATNFAEEKQELKDYLKSRRLMPEMPPSSPLVDVFIHGF